MTAPDVSSPRQPQTGIWVLLAGFLLLATGAWERPLFDADEGRYGSVAVNMVESGDWVVPHLNDMPFMDKPPLVYWVQAVWTRAFGSSEFAARLPTLLAGAFVALFLFLFTRAWTGASRPAWLAALAWSTSAACMVGSRVGPQMDMPLCACICGTLYAAWCGIRWPRRRTALGLGLAVGLGLLVKGPLVVAVPLFVSVAWMLAGVEPRRVARIVFSPWSIGIALLIAAPWYVAVERAQPGWIRHFIEHEHFGRFGRGDHRSFHPFWYYVPVACVYLAPWTLLAWGGKRGIASIVTGSPWAPATWHATLAATSPLGKDDRAVRNAHLAWGWFLAAFVLYSLSTRKLLNYLLPAAPPLFILVGVRLHRGLRDASGRVLALPLLLALGGGLLAALVAGGWWFPLRTGVLPTAIEQPRWAPLAPWLGGAAAALAVGALVVRAQCTSTVRGAVLILAVATSWWLLDWGFARVGDLGSSRALAHAMQEHQRPGDAVVALKRYPQGLDFYGAPPVWIAGGTPDAWWQREIVNPYAQAVWAARPAPGAEAENRGALLTSEAFERLWGGSRRVLLVCRWREIELLGAHRVAGPFGGAGRTDLYLVTNHP